MIHAAQVRSKVKQRQLIAIRTAIQFLVIENTFDNFRISPATGKDQCLYLKLVISQM